LIAFISKYGHLSQLVAMDQGTSEEIRDVVRNPAGNVQRADPQPEDRVLDAVSCWIVLKRIQTRSAILLLASIAVILVMIIAPRIWPHYRKQILQLHM
jgi:hypothetical protein